MNVNIKLKKKFSADNDRNPYPNWFSLSYHFFKIMKNLQSLRISFFSIIYCMALVIWTQFRWHGKDFNFCCCFCFKEINVTTFVSVCQSLKIGFHFDTKKFFEWIQNSSIKFLERVCNFNVKKCIPVLTLMLFLNQKQWIWNLILFTSK